MEKKNNNGLLIGLLIGIIIMLIILICLFATGTISFNISSENDKQQAIENNLSNTTDDNILTESVAVAIVKSLYNEDVRYIFNEKVAYCGVALEDGEEIKIEKNGFFYYKSAKFHSFNELKENLGNYMTETLLNNTNFNYSTVIEGNTITSYYEKDGNLYCNTWNKGGNVSRTNYSVDESTFMVSNLKENSFDASITAIYNWDGTQKTKLQINVSLIKQNDKWLLNTYEEKQ